ncbi:hypothetical protein LOD99_6002 [Oopsacas minuta]|uniref:Uncharacterized protein n=1 Tax=Oopsacas minuta TaxID=111878 RepID=A0AAV7JN40_9METZ|nr:hypothetical protein LOD99_6002 [Oopsacas minuta]
MEYSNRCQNEISLKKMNHLIDESKLNLSRHIYTEKKTYDDKLKFQISAALMEKKLSGSIGKFQEAIIKNVDNYLEFNVEQQTQAFEDTWIQCFGDEDKNEEVFERDETFNNLHSLFMMESISMEKSSEIREYS